MEGTPKAIEIQGIVRNATKIGVQDGQAEDLINLRFMDGSWRASGDGRLIDFDMNVEYAQLYVHTNVYHHLLGVRTENGVSTLYWFAEIGTDGTTFYPLDNTTSRTNWPSDMQDLPTAPVALTTVVGDIWITQTGHLITIIDEADDFEFFVFKTGDNQYIEVITENDQNAASRSLYPFGKIHFNIVTDDTDEYKYSDIDSDQRIKIQGTDGACVPQNNESETHAAAQIWHAQMLKVFKAATEANRFTGAFFIAAAIKLYDGSFVYASNPVLLNPREKTGMDDDLTVQHNGEDCSTTIIATTGVDGYTGEFYKIIDGSLARNNDTKIEAVDVQPDQETPTTEQSPLFVSGASDRAYFSTLGGSWIGWVSAHAMESIVRGADVACSLEDSSFLEKNKSVFQSLCIFITPQVHPFDMSEDGYKEGVVRLYDKRYVNTVSGDNNNHYSQVRNVTYNPPRIGKEKMIYDLTHSPFFLLREYDARNISELLEKKIIDLSSPEYESILLPEKILEQKRLQTESLSRTTYIPSVAYLYNNRLHIANYKSYPFFGYPIDIFHLHNHSVKVQDNSWFPANANGKRVLKNITGNNDEDFQYTKRVYDFWDSAINYQGGATQYQGVVMQRGHVFAYVKVYIEGSNGEQIVARYILPYQLTVAENGRADFVEALNPLLTYPDARAKKMAVFIMGTYNSESFHTAYVRSYYKEFDLKPHPYLNMAYYIATDLKPIEFTYGEMTLADYYDQTGSYAEADDEHPKRPSKAPAMQNIEEYFPNGLKVSKADNPMYFPVENTYQIGSAEILALMSNTIAVGTGQTGDAPLYIFCKDGVYAAFVDASGEMVYPNTRPLAPDVCNNPRSVTKTDFGVVFTTDRGLMRMNGEQVEEIGAPAEGDVLKYADTTSGNKEFIKIANGALRRVAELPNTVTATDFLTYLKDEGTTGKAAIINYNHNLRELIVTNPNYPYSYVLDRDGNWSRRYFTAKEYVNNYPTSYRVVNEGTAANPAYKFYKLDEEGDGNTPLEQRKEADNKIFYLSREIKLDSIGFKQGYRFVVRGYFETGQKHAGTANFNGTDVYFVSDDFANYELGTELNTFYYSAGLEGVDGFELYETGISEAYVSNVHIYEKDTLLDITEERASRLTPGGKYLANTKLTICGMPMRVGIYVFGSYDGRKWALLGRNERSGKFTDIGCRIERTDVKFFRVCLAGQVTGKTRIDYTEMSAGASMLNTKIR